MGDTDVFDFFQQVIDFLRKKGMKISWTKRRKRHKGVDILLPDSEIKIDAFTLKYNLKYCQNLSIHVFFEAGSDLENALIDKLSKKYTHEDTFLAYLRLRDNTTPVLKEHGIHNLHTADPKKIAETLYLTVTDYQRWRKETESVRGEINTKIQKVVDNLK